MRNFGYVWVVIIIMLLLDFYVFEAVKLVSQGASSKQKMFIYGGYWAISLAAVIFLATIPFTNFGPLGKTYRTYLLATILGLFFAKLLALVFFLLDDIRRLIQWASGKLFFRNTDVENLGD